MRGRISARLSAVHSNHKRIAKGALYTSLLVLVAKACVALREVAIAWRYGISAEVDAYQLAFTVATWLPMTLAGVATVVLVPRMIAVRGQSAAPKLREELNGAFLAAGVAMAALTLFAGPSAVDLIGNGLEPATLALGRTAAWQLAPVALAVLLGGYLGARLQAKEHYAFSLTEAAPPLGITICVLATPGGSSLLPLVWGTLGGYLLYVTWLAVMTMRVDPPLGRPKLHRTPELWRPLYVSFLTMGLAQVLITLTLPIDQAFAAQLGEGAIATLGYANRIVMLVTGLGAVVLGRALLPILSEAAASSAERSLGERQATRWAILMFVVGLVILGMGWVLAPTAVRILFERGAFEASDTIVVSGLLRVGLVQVPMFLAGMVLVQWYAAADRYRAILAITSAALIAKIVSNVMLVETLGLEGIMLGTAVMYSVTMLAMAIGVRRPGAEVRVR